MGCHLPDVVVAITTYSLSHTNAREAATTAGGRVASMPEFAGYGPEPLSEDFSLDYLKQALSRRSVMLEVALMNQQIVAGIGKIYADEICFRAGLRPTRRASSLTGPMRERPVPVDRRHDAPPGGLLRNRQTRRRAGTAGDS